MGLKHNNSNGEIILARKLNLVQQFLLKNCENCILNESYKLFFWQVAQIAWKTRLSITFSLLVQIEWIKDSHVDKNIIFLR